jgi:Zn ribbon nucleic-acid-binding protein
MVTRDKDDLKQIPQLQKTKKVAFKVCPKCHGNLGVESDNYGTFESCVQCGYEKDI